MVQTNSDEGKWVWLLCVFAAIHVFIFSAAFPFFNNVDEEAHFDLAVKFSNGQLPRTLAPMAAESMNYYVLYISQEYLWPPPPGKQFPPPMWLWPPEKAAPVLAARKVQWNDPNHESSQPPLYYALTGFWWQVGKLCGLHGGLLLYWLRFLNLFFVVALVWLGYTAARLVFPADKFLRLGVPALLAFLPQTAFYSIQTDVLSPVCFGAAYILLLRMDREEMPDLRLGATIGLTLAATFLTKLNNLPLLLASAIFIGWKIWRLNQNGKLRAALPSLLALAVCAGLPITGWLAWCKYNFGDFTGSAAKIQLLGWTHKPFVEWWQHPIFTPHGLGIFLSKLLATFWQGEFLWHRQPLTSPIVDAVYAILSAALIALAFANLRPQVATTTDAQRRALGFGGGCFIASVAFLGFLSIIYDFHDCYYPSRAHPYFTSGRLLLGGLIPFVLLFVFGLDHALSRTKSHRARPLALGGIILFMLISEIVNDWPVFFSEYNWFHL
jgi:hypothetical protein